MNKTATFNNLENAKLREFADLCADMESQMSYLPGLACLIFPNAIQLIPERLPLLLCQKWEKEISKHTECLAFHAKSLDEGTEWLLAAGLCYCCLSKGHTASDCKENIECSRQSHAALLHRERTRPPTQGGEAIDSKCRSMCHAIEGGASCSKLL